MFEQFAEVRAKHKPEFWGTGYVIDIVSAAPSHRIVFWVGDAGNDGTARCLMMFHVDNLTEV